MLSILLLCIAMLSAAWAYTSMMKSGEFTMGGMPVKYKIILIIYIIVAFFILWAGGPFVFMIYAVIAGIGAACGWFFTKNNTDDNTGKSKLRVPVRLQVIDNTNASITDYTRKTNASNANNDASSTDTTTQQSSDTVNNNDNNDNKTQQTTDDTSSSASNDTASNSSDNTRSQQANSTDETNANANIVNTSDNATTTTSQLESDSTASSDSTNSSSDNNDKSSASNHVNTDEHD